MFIPNGLFIYLFVCCYCWNSVFLNIIYLTVTAGSRANTTPWVSNQTPLFPLAEWVETEAVLDSVYTEVPHH